MRWMLFTSRFIFSLGVVILVPFILKASNSEEMVQKLFKAESEQMWEEALNLGSMLEKQLTEVQADELKSHINRLRKAVNSLHAAEFYQQSGLNTEAQAVLTEILNELDKKQDQFLVVVIKEKLKLLENKIYGPAREDAKAMLALGFRLLASRKYDEAKTVFDSIISTAQQGADEEVKNKAKKGQIQAEIAMKEPVSLPQDTWNSLREVFRNIIVLLFYFIFIIAVFYIFRGMTRVIGYRKGIGVALEDHTAGENERAVRDYNLNRDFVHIVNKIASSRVGEMETYEQMDFNSVNLPNITSSLGGIATIETHIDTSPVKIGPFSFTSKQLFTYFSLLFRPRYEYMLSGVLITEGTQTVLRVEKRKNRKNAPVCQSFESIVEGTDQLARTNVLRGVAAQFVVSTARAITTDDWRSLRSFLEADELLARLTNDSTNHESLLTDALKKLTTSLRFDPSNWMARYKIASVLGKLDRNREAAEQFEYLQKMLRSGELWESRQFSELLKIHPDFLWIIRYNYAVVQSRRKSSYSKDMAINILEELIHNAETILTKGNVLDSQVNRQSKTGPIYSQVKIKASQTRRISILAHGALAVARSAKLKSIHHRLKNQPDTQVIAACKVEMNELFDKIKADEKWLYNYVHKIAKGEWQGYIQAHAAAQNACGIGYYLIENYVEARKFFEWAISYQMPANFIDPYINLAEVFINQKQNLNFKWADRAEKALKNALAVNPDNKKANYLLGVLYAQPEIEKYDQALTHLEKAETNAECFYLKAEILIKHKKEIEAGLKLLLRIVKNAEAELRYISRDLILKTHDFVGNLINENVEDPLKLLPDLDARLIKLKGNIEPPAG